MSIYGVRGTGDLLPEQRPRRRKMRGRSQPYRRKDRPLGPTLEAILRGEPAYLPNPADYRRAGQRALKRSLGR